MAINTVEVPAKLHGLIPMAAKWGIGDDYERERMVSSAGEEELAVLVHCIDDVSDDDLFGWLEGDESYSAMPSESYLAFTCLTMAIESARSELQKRRAMSQK